MENQSDEALAVERELVRLGFETVIKIKNDYLTVRLINKNFSRCDSVSLKRNEDDVNAKIVNIKRSLLCRYEVENYVETDPDVRILTPTHSRKELPLLKSEAKLLRRKILILDAQTKEPLMIAKTQREASRLCDIPQSSIYKVLVGKLKQSGGFTFTFAR